jgi:hypothetical protein
MKESASAASSAAAADQFSDLFVLGRAAQAAARAASNGRGIFGCWRRLSPTGWQGPASAASAFVEECDLVGLGGIATVAAAGANTIVATSISTLIETAGHGLRGLLRLSLMPDESVQQQETRLAALAGEVRAGLLLDGVVPTPADDGMGLATVTFVAHCRLALPGVAHVIADLNCLGPKLGQLALGFGADELCGPIVAERPLRLGDHAASRALTRVEAAQLLRGAGLRACERVAGGALEEFPL